MKRIGETVRGPTGPVPGAMIGQELHFPGEVENKTFAPGYGEFFSGVGGDVEVTALAVPTDAAPGPTPAQLETVFAGAIHVYEQTRSEDWAGAAATVRTMASAWRSFQDGDVPSRLGAQITRELEEVARAVGARKLSGASHEALDVANANLDLELRYRSPVEIDMSRFEVWVRQLQLDAEAKNEAAVLGDVTILEWIRDRVTPDDSDRSRIDDQLRYLRAAADAGEFKVVTEDAARLRDSFTKIAITP